MALSGSSSVGGNCRGAAGLCQEPSDEGRRVAAGAGRASGLAVQQPLVKRRAVIGTEHPTPAV